MNNGSLIRFFWKSLLLLVVLVVCDRAIGWWLEKMFYAQKHGDNFVSIYLLEHANEDVVFLGGSRASHHFNAQLIQDSTGLTCFNGGRDNMAIDYINAVLPEVYKQHVPKIVVMDIVPFDLTANDHDRQALRERTAAALLPFCYRHPALKTTIAKAGTMELMKIKVSHIYPFNSTIGPSIQNAYTNIGHISVKGYEPLSATIDPATYKAPLWGTGTAGNPIDTAIFNSFRSVVQQAKQHNVRLIAMLSPFYFENNNFKINPGYKVLTELFKNEGVEFYDYSLDERFLNKPYLFADDVHLNDSGATIYSKMIANIIKQEPIH